MLPDSYPTVQTQRRSRSSHTRFNLAGNNNLRVRSFEVACVGYWSQIRTSHDCQFFKLSIQPRDIFTNDVPQRVVVENEIATDGVCDGELDAEVARRSCGHIELYEHVNITADMQLITRRLPQQRKLAHAELGLQLLFELCQYGERFVAGYLRVIPKGTRHMWDGHP